MLEFPESFLLTQPLIKNSGTLWFREIFALTMQTSTGPGLVLLFICIYNPSVNKNCIFNPLTAKISFVILFTVCHTVLVMLILRIWYLINLQSPN